jgi:hypothetical protein
MGSSSSFERYSDYASSYSPPTSRSSSSWSYDTTDYEDERARQRAREEREREERRAKEVEEEKARLRSARLASAKATITAKETSKASSTTSRSASPSMYSGSGAMRGFSSSSDYSSRDPEYAPEEPIDRKYVNNKITKPKAHTQRVHIVLVDNSGSNATIARHLRRSADYLNAMGMIVDAQAEIAYLFFSDHCDDDLLSQEVGYTSPSEEGGKYFKNSMKTIHDANGGDEPEAIECILNDVSNLDFGTVTEKHLYLVTDVLAHGMGMPGDKGCPHGVNWEESLAKAYGVFNTISVIGCSSYDSIAKKQLQFVRNPNDLIDLSGIRSQQYRLGIVGNAILFAMSKNRGVEYAENFLSDLYEKWLAEPLFGANTDISAKEGISRFIKFLGLTEDQEKEMETRIFN